MITNFTVGPAKLYHGVEKFLCECLQNGYGELSHRSQKFTQISKETLTNFREFFEVPEDYKIFYTYSATEGLELAIKNLVNKYVTHISNGNFGDMWAGLSEKTGKTVQKFSLETENLQHGERVDGEKIFPKIFPETELVCITANETASGVAYSPKEISHFSTQLQKKFPETLLAVDITSGIGGYAYDFSSADIWAFSVQKALGLPAGLGLLVVSPKAYKKSVEREKNGFDVGAHHSLLELEKKMIEKFQTPSTPNFLAIAGLGFVCKEFQKNFKNIKTLENKRKEKAEFLYDFFESQKKFFPRVGEKNARSQTIIIITGAEKDLAEKFEELKNFGIEVGKGYGDYKTQDFRIGNFPVHSLEDLKNLVEKF